MSDAKLKNSRWADKHGEIRVMCEPIDGYVLVRRKGSMPFAVFVKDLERDFTPIIGTVL